MLFDATGLHAYHPETGIRQWSYDWGDGSDEQVNVCQPAAINEQEILISSGYGRGSALIDVVESDHGIWSVKTQWKSKRLRSKFASIVIKDGFAYGLDEGILACIDLSNGERRWKRGRLGHGQLLLCNDALIIQCESGEIALVRADPDTYQLIRQIKCFNDRSWNYPILVGNRLLCRNDREAVCFEITNRESGER